MMLYFLNKGFQQVLKEFQEAAERDKNVKRIPYGNWRELVKIANCSSVRATLTDANSALWLFEGNDRVSCTTVEVPYTFVTIMERYAVSIMDQHIAPEQNKKENDTMTKTNIMPAMNFDFGPVRGGVSISPYGLAIQDKQGNWLTYNAASGQTVDVTGFTFEFENMIYKMPAAVTSIAPGDMILHQGRPMYVTAVDKNIEAVDILDSEMKTVIPVTNMFGFNFVTKITSLVNLGNAQPSAENPFGNLMPMMMANAMFNGDSEMDFGKMMMVSAMMGGANPFANMFNFGAPASAV